MKQWILRAGLVGLGACAGSFFLEVSTRFAIWQLVPRVHDVQFALLITVISFFGCILGAVSTAVVLLVKSRRFKFSGWLALVCGVSGIALSAPQIVMARRGFDENAQPFIDAVAFVGLTASWSMALVISGVLLVIAKANKSPSC